MSTNPAKRGPIGPDQIEATGVFSPEIATSADLSAGEPTPPPQPGFEATAALPPLDPPPAADVTGVFVPEPPSAAGGPAAPVGGATEATGVFLPGAGHAPAGDATGAFLPGAGEAGASDATGAFLPGGGAAPADGATGMYLPPGTSAPAGGATDQQAIGGATGAYQSGQGGGADATLGPPAAAAAAPPKPAPDRARRYGRYVLKRFHAKGGMGEIWLAEDPDIGRSVALKRMLGKRDDAKARFVVEAQITGQLEHPGIVPVHELGTMPDGQPYYVMKFVHGRTLKKVIQAYHESLAKGGADVEVEELRLMQHFISLCQTVAYAHSKGVLHRDLKPENVMLGPFGETLLLDWGIAKVLGRPEAAPTDATYVELKGDGIDTGTQAGAIMGSPSYMAPEVAAGLNDQVDQVSDVYLLGATLYEILTGSVPRKADTMLELIRQAQHAPPVPPRRVNPRAPRALEAICLKAMSSAKADRYQSALEVADEVQRYLAGEPVLALPEGPWERAKRWAKKHKTAIARAAVAALFAAVIVGAAVAIRNVQKDREQAAKAAEDLRRREQATGDLKEFRRLADEAQFYAATTDSMSEQAPYFDPARGEETGRAAAAVLTKWGQDLDGLPLPDEKAPARQELYDLLLLMAQLKSVRGADEANAKETLALLDRASPLHEATRSFYRLQSQAHRALGDEGKAAEEQQRADDPKTPDTALDHFLLGERYRHETVKDASARTERAVWEVNQSRVRKAVEEYRAALALDPKHFWARFQVGRGSVQLKQPAEAVEALTYCVAQKPTSPWGYTVRGLVLGQLSRYAEAGSDLTRAIDLAPDLRLARLHRGVVYRFQKKDEEALADFDKVLEPPDDKRVIEAAYYRGEIHLQRGEIDKALADFDLVVKERPDLRSVYTDRAQIYMAKGEEPRALEDLDRYIALAGPYDPNSAAGHAARGHLFRFLKVAPSLEERKSRLGLADLDEAVRKGASSVELFDDLGATLETAGKTKEAVLAYSKGLELNQNDVILLVERGWALEALGKHNEAQGDFLAALRREPKNAEAHSGLGYVRAVLKAQEAAQQEADLALLHVAEMPLDRQYLVVHNVACIYATLSQVDAKRTVTHQDVTIALLRRAIELWKQGKGARSEIELIQDEPAFPAGLRKRQDFNDLLKSDAG
jgi:tetratricopeptide (TPR) repeat protein